MVLISSSQRQTDVAPGLRCRTHEVKGLKQRLYRQYNQTPQDIKTGVNTISTEVQQILALERRLSLQQEDMLVSHKKEEDIKILIQALPTKTDLEALICRVEEAHRKEIQVIHGQSNRQSQNDSQQMKVRRRL